MRVQYSILYIVFATVLLLGSCKKTEELIDFTEEDEILLGEKLATALVESSKFNIIPEEGNSIPYAYANSRLQELVNTSVITKGEEFNWTITLLDNESRQAYALPGGSIYVTSGMIFYLSIEDEFSGLLAHLVAHIDQSHLTERLFFKYGVNGLKTIATSGDQSELEEVIQDLDLFGSFLQLSRASELEADTLSISILAETGQSCESSGLFFSRVLNVQPTGQAALISAHRLDDSRIEDIQNVVLDSGCDASVDDESGIRYRSFRNSLP